MYFNLAKTYALVFFVIFCTGLFAKTPKSCRALLRPPHEIADLIPVESGQEIIVAGSTGGSSVQTGVHEVSSFDSEWGVEVKGHNASAGLVTDYATIAKKTTSPDGVTVKKGDRVVVGAYEYDVVEIGSDGGVLIYEGEKQYTYARQYTTPVKSLTVDGVEVKPGARINRTNGGKFLSVLSVNADGSVIASQPTLQGDQSLGYNKKLVEKPVRLAPGQFSAE